MKQINIIFGGSFNPPTKAHLQIALYLTSKYDVTSFLFMPTSVNYNKKGLVSNTHRVNMLNIMCKYIKNSSVSTFELDQKEYLGTYMMLKSFPSYYFVMGADNLIDIKSWKHFPDVIKDNKFIVLNRNKLNLDNILNDEDVIKYKDNFIIENDIDILDISSSLYRKTKDASIVIEEVYDYIKQNNLY